MSISNCSHCGRMIDTDDNYETNPYFNDNWSEACICDSCFELCFDEEGELIPKLDNQNWLDLNLMEAE